MGSGVEYGQAYFDKYVHYSRTILGGKLTEQRVELVRRHHRGPLLDVGVGCGAFMRAWLAETGQHAWGYDINPVAVEWLQEHRRFWDPYRRPVAVATMWDVIEHIEDFPALLRQVEEGCILCTPTYTGPEHVLMSRHYRPGEHCWYFTEAGLVGVMGLLGWSLTELCRVETVLGRQDITSFAFRRV